MRLYADVYSCTLISCNDFSSDHSWEAQVFLLPVADDREKRQFAVKMFPLLPKLIRSGLRSPRFPAQAPFPEGITLCCNSIPNFMIGDLEDRLVHCIGLESLLVSCERGIMAAKPSSARRKFRMRFESGGIV